MRVSVEGGKGRGKSMNSELNLVPFIDFLSCLIAFLMITAVWSEIAALEQEQAISNSNTPPQETQEEPVKPLVVQISADRVRAERYKDDPTKPAPFEFSKTPFEQRAETVRKLKESGQPVPEPEHIAKLREWLETDRKTWPTEEMVTIFTEDGVPYADMMEVLDVTRIVGCDAKKLATEPKSCGYQKTAMAGGPASTATPAPAGKGG